MSLDDLAETVPKGSESSALDSLDKLDTFEYRDGPLAGQPQHAKLGRKLSHVAKLAILRQSNVSGLTSDYK